MTHNVALKPYIPATVEALRKLACHIEAGEVDVIMLEVRPDRLEIEFSALHRLSDVRAELAEDREVRGG